MSRPRLGVSLSRAHRAFMAVLEVQLKALRLYSSVRPAMGPVLFALLEEDNLTLSELGSRARLAPSTVTELVKKMTGLGLVRRKRDAQDARASRLQLTRKARGLQLPLEELDRRLDRIFAAELSKQEVATLIRLLERLRSALSEEAQGVGDELERDNVKSRAPGRG
jgi:DNA-binding MarR family transcriptional regulator